MKKPVRDYIRYLTKKLGQPDDQTKEGPIWYLQDGPQSSFLYFFPKLAKNFGYSYITSITKIFETQYSWSIT